MSVGRTAFIREKYLSATYTVRTCSPGLPIYSIVSLDPELIATTYFLLSV